MAAIADEGWDLSFMKHVCIVSGDHLWINPRVVKEADVLSDAGFRVTVVAPALTPFDHERDQTILRGRTWRKIDAPDLLHADIFGAGRFMARLARRAQILGVRWLGYPLSGSLGYRIGATVRVAADLNADLYSCHLEPGLVALARLARMGRRCVFDFEDWHSRDLDPSTHRDRPLQLISRLERKAINEAEFTTTTSEALADALVVAYGGKRPIVIYNAFEHTKSSALSVGPADRQSSARPSLHWYSQVVGPGRGLEPLFDAVNLLEQDFELHIRGGVADDFKRSLLDRLSPVARQKVFFHPTTDPAELPSRIAEHDIGFALEARTPASRDLTITNKVFQYLQGGCAIIASRTNGQEEAGALFPGAITLTELEPSEIAAAIAGLLDDPGRLQRAQAAAEIAASGLGSWEHLSRPLVARYREAFGPDDREIRW